MSFESDARVAELRFSGELSSLVRRSGRALFADCGGLIRYPVRRRASIKDVVEALGVPHTEVYGVTVNSRDSDLGRLLCPGDRVMLFPAVPPVDVTVPTRLRPAPLSELRFLVDENVAGVVLLLRALGFDAAYHRTWDDETIADLAEREHRFVLSRDRALLKRTRIMWGRLLQSQDPDGQLAETVRLLGITRAPAPFVRCLRCNVPTTPVAKQEVLHRLEPKTRKYFNEFRLCKACNRLYWRGSHHARLRERLEATGVKIG